MLRSCLIVILSIGAAVCLPQVTVTKDGQVGVNFGGYHAEAGLGGPSGLSASAGTPNGQNAKAGIGGSNGDGLFAEANAGGGVGASATLNGESNGAEGEANAQTNTRVYTKKVVYSSSNVNSGSVDVAKQKEYTATPQPENYFGFQKFFGFPTYTKQVRYQPVEYYRKTYQVRPLFSKQIITGPIQPEPIAEKVSPEESSTRVYNKEIHVTANGNKYKQGLFDAIFQIPIATLQAVNNLVKQATSGGATYTKTISVN